MEAQLARPPPSGVFFFFQAEDGIREHCVTGVQTCALPISLDTRRPAAMEQLAVLGKQVGVETLPIVRGQSAVQIARRALEAARLGGFDVVMLDTAGRVTVDEGLMAEAAEVKAATNPHE